MQTILKSVIPVLLLALPVWTAPAQFQGRVVSDNVASDETGAPKRYRMTVTLGPGAGRIETDSRDGLPPTVMIARKDPPVLWMLDPAAKSYMEVRRVRAHTGADSAAHAVHELPPSMRRTGKKTKLLGYPCEEILMKQGEMETRLMVTDRLADLARTMQSLFAAGSGEEEPGAAALYRLGLYPLSSASSYNREVIESQYVTAVERLAPDSTLFVVPQGYRRQSAPGTSIPR